MNRVNRLLQFVKEFSSLTSGDGSDQLDDVVFLLIYKSLLMQELESLEEIMIEHDYVKMHRAVDVLKNYGEM